jgi:hypothetical protein
LTGIFDLISKERDTLRGFEDWPGLRNRSHLEEYAKAELELIREFDKARSASHSPSTIEIEGFVSRLSGRRQFVLRPCLSVDYGILCDLGRMRSSPTDYELVRVKGKRVLSKTTSRYASPYYLEVEAVERIRAHGISLKPEISLKDAEEHLLGGYPDLPRQIRRNLLSSIISSPGDMTRTGGLTATLLPLESSFAERQYLLLEDLRKSIPPDLTSRYSLRVRIPEHGEFTIAPFPWSMHNTSNELWDQEKDAGLLLRKSTGGIQEVTIGFSSTLAVPKSLDDIWLTRADFPMLVDAETPARMSASRLNLDLAKFFIVVHTNYPFVESQVDEKLDRLIMPRLLKLRRDYDSRGYGGLVDLDTDTGNPQSILSIAKTMARGEGSEGITEEHVAEAVTLFADAREDVLETWSKTDRGLSSGRRSYRMEVQKTGKTGERIVNFLINHPNSTRGEINDAIPRVQDRIFDHAFGDLLARNLIYKSDFKDNRYSATNESW